MLGLARQVGGVGVGDAENVLDVGHGDGQAAYEHAIVLGCDQGTS